MTFSHRKQVTRETNVGCNTAITVSAPRKILGPGVELSWRPLAGYTAIEGVSDVVVGYKAGPFVVIISAYVYRVPLCNLQGIRNKLKNIHEQLSLSKGLTEHCFIPQRTPTQSDKSVSFQTLLLLF